MGWSGLSDAYVALAVHPVGPHGDSPAARAVREGRSVAVPDVGVAEDYGRMRSLAPTQGYRALLAAPLRTARSGLAGVVVAYSMQAMAFSELEIELIEMLADQAALALETSRLRGDQQSVIRELSVANAELRTGRAALERAELPTVFRVARGAARLRRAHRRGGVIDVRELGLSALTRETGTPGTLRRFAQDLLHPVVAHDADRGGDLLLTLRAWLEPGFSIQATAAALVVHPNTVTYRLGRIEQLTGRGLRLPDVRLELQLALTVHDIIWLDG